MGSEEATEAEPLPSPSAELVLIRVFVQAHLATAPRKQAAAFLRHVATLLENEESIARLLPIRPCAQHGEVTRAQRGALALFRRYVPSFVAAMQRE